MTLAAANKDFKKAESKDFKMQQVRIEEENNWKKYVNEVEAYKV